MHKQNAKEFKLLIWLLISVIQDTQLPPAGYRLLVVSILVTTDIDSQVYYMSNQGSTQLPWEAGLCPSTACYQLAPYHSLCQVKSLERNFVSAVHRTARTKDRWPTNNGTQQWLSGSKQYEQLETWSGGATYPLVVDWAVVELSDGLLAARLGIAQLEPFRDVGKGGSVVIGHVHLWKGTWYGMGANLQVRKPSLEPGHSLEISRGPMDNWTCAWLKRTKFRVHGEIFIGLLILAKLFAITGTVPNGQFCPQIHLSGNFIATYLEIHRPCSKVLTAFRWHKTEKPIGMIYLGTGGAWKNERQGLSGDMNFLSETCPDRKLSVQESKFVFKTRQACSWVEG